MEYDPGKFWSQITNICFYLIHKFLIQGWFGLLIIFVLSPVVLSSQSFTKVTLQEISSFIDKVKNYREGYTNYQAKFRENIGNNLLIGDIYYAKPEKLRVTYRRGNRVVTEVFLGEDKLIVYFVDSSIVYEQENFNVNEADSVSLVPGSLDYLIKNYNLNFIDREPAPVFINDEYRLFNLTKPPNHLAYHLRLTPKSVTEGLDDLEIWLLAEKSGIGEYNPTQVIRSRFLNKEGGFSDIYYSEIQTNQIFPADTFNFVIPINARVIKNYLPALGVMNLEEGLEIRE